MSRIGKKAIPIPEGVQIHIDENTVEATGPKGTVKNTIPSIISVQVDEDQKVIQVGRPNDLKESKAFQGLARALINNAVTGVSTGFRKQLEIVGTGYNVKLRGKHIEFQIGYCLPQIVMIPDGITAEVPSPTKLVLMGANKHQLGQLAANIRAIRPPEPYKGKGIRYQGEVIKLKAGKSFAGSG